MSGGNEYGQCGEEPERKDDTGRLLRRDITIPQRCAPKLVVRQVISIFQCHIIMELKLFAFVLFLSQSLMLDVYFFKSLVSLHLLLIPW